MVSLLLPKLHRWRRPDYRRRPWHARQGRSRRRRSTTNPKHSGSMQSTLEPDPDTQWHAGHEEHVIDGHDKDGEQEGHPDGRTAQPRPTTRASSRAALVTKGTNASAMTGPLHFYLEQRVYGHLIVVPLCGRFPLNVTSVEITTINFMNFINFINFKNFMKFMKFMKF